MYTQSMYFLKNKNNQFVSRVIKSLFFSTLNTWQHNVMREVKSQLLGNTFPYNA